MGLAYYPLSTPPASKMTVSLGLGGALEVRAVAKESMTVVRCAAAWHGR